MPEENISELFGVSEEVLEKSKDIYPTFDIGKLEEESKIFLKVRSEKPKPVEHLKKFNKGKDEDKDTKITTGTLLVEVQEVYRPEKNGEMLALPYNNELYTLWLSSVSLSMGFARLYKDNGNSLKDLTVKITIGTANYKEFGENRVYRVSKIEPTSKPESKPE